MPAFRHILPGNEFQLRRIPVALHKTFDVAAIPRRRLIVHYFFDRCFHFFILVLREDIDSQKKKQNVKKHRNFIHNRVVYQWLKGI